MNKITKDNLVEFIKKYNNLHDSYITNINYDITKSKIELLIDLYSPSQLASKEDNNNKTKMKMVLNGVEKYSNKEMFSWDYLNNVLIKYIKLGNKEFICFASDEEEPLLYIVCESIEYEEII